MASETIDLIVTSDVRDHPYEKKYPSGLRLGDLKKKLELVVGIRGECMAVELRDKFGKFLASLSDDNSTLADLGIKAAATFVEDSSAVQKFTIPDQNYDQRENTLRAWKRTHGFDKLNPSSVQSSEYEKPPESFKVGCRCIVRIPNKETKMGTISFVGVTKFKSGYWIGVKYDEPVGKNDGSVDGERYFACDEFHGAFVRPGNVFLMEDDDEFMEEI